VGLEVAATRPEAVGALALLCAAMPGRLPGPRLRSYTERKRSLLAAGDIAAAVELSITTSLGPEAGHAARARVRLMRRQAFEMQRAARFTSADAPTDLRRITAPCLAVSGLHDLSDFREIASGLPQRVARARHLELPWAGHFPGLERPDEVTAELTAFLSETFPAR
jgi:3-oxoadipate enol-lactonase